jgi:hypothetical protein
MYYRPQIHVSTPSGLLEPQHCVGPTLATSSGWRLRVCASWHLPTADASRNADRSLLLSHRPRDVQPDCLASRSPGDLDDLEQVVAHVEAARSIEAAADQLRSDIVLPSAVRWVRRRLTLVRATLLTIVTLLPDLGGDARVGTVRAALATDRALVALRARRGAAGRAAAAARIRASPPIATRTPREGPTQPGG